MHHVIENCVFVVVSPRIPAETRSTGEKVVTGTKIEEHKQVVLDPAYLGPLKAIKSAVRRKLMTAGTPIESIGAWMIPTKVWPDIKTDIEDLKSRWEAGVKDLASRVSEQVDALCARHPEDADGIRAFAPTTETFTASARFLYGAYSLQPDQVIESAAMAAEFDDLPGQVIDDLKKIIKDNRKDMNATGVYSASTRDFLIMLADKAAGFGFLHDSLVKIADVIRGVAMGLAPGASVNGAQAKQVKELLDKLLGSPEELLREGLTISPVEVQAMMESVVVKATPAVKPATDKPARPKVKVTLAPKARQEPKRQEREGREETVNFDDDLSDAFEVPGMMGRGEIDTDFLCI